MQRAACKPRTLPRKAGHPRFGPGLRQCSYRRQTVDAPANPRSDERGYHLIVARIFHALASVATV